MERKRSTTVVAVTADEVKAALAKTKNLTSEEEKSVRMRHGVGSTDPRAPLPRAAGSNAELADELLLIEMQLLKAHRAMMGAKKAPVLQAARISTSQNVTKNKIVRALRKKK
jgi:hypothetical protein